MVFDRSTAYRAYTALFDLDRFFADFEFRCLYLGRCLYRNDGGQIDAQYDSCFHALVFSNFLYNEEDRLCLGSVGKFCAVFSISCSNTELVILEKREKVKMNPSSMKARENPKESLICSRRLS